MRAVLLINPKPCIPYLGIIRQDLAAMQAARKAGVDPSRQIRTQLGNINCTCHGMSKALLWIT